jgi:hypothetical protein
MWHATMVYGRSVEYGRQDIGMILRQGCGGRWNFPMGRHALPASCVGAANARHLPVAAIVAGCGCPNFAKAEADRGAGETVLIQDRNRWVDAAYQWAGTRQPQQVEGVPSGLVQIQYANRGEGKVVACCWLLVAGCLLDNIAKTVRRCAATSAMPVFPTHSPCRLHCSGRYPTSSRWQTGVSQSGSIGHTHARANPES